MRPVALAGILASTTILSGCAATIGGISLSSLSSFAGFASTLFTGADLGEHAASLITGKDCRFSEGLLREDRDVCEEPGSPATRNDFHGIFVERIDPDGTIIYAAPKYMSAGVGAGENENNPDKIWAEIKTQKAKEENERQLARAQAAQTIDVAALATGSLSPESLAFLPGGVVVESEFAIDGDTASQAAVGPRAVVNVARKKVRNEVRTPPAAKTPEVGPLTDQPAIDEKTLAAPLQALKANGAGGPLIASTTSGTPVTSTIINGEPVVVLRIGPIAAASTAASAQPAAAMTAEFAGDETTTLVAHASTQPVSPAPSPLAVLGMNGASATKQATLEVAKLEPQMLNARPRRKPRVDLTPTPPQEVAAVRTQELSTPDLTDSATAQKQPRTARVKKLDVAADVDIYRPPVRTEVVAAPESNGTAYRASDAPYSPVQTPSDVPPPPPEPEPSAAALAPATTSDEPATPATSGPAQLVPTPQE